ncbi:MAG: beta-ketoacyl synthase N-terminal-like domain-containing protein [Myxococcota bacterium]
MSDLLQRWPSLVHDALLTDERAREAFKAERRAIRRDLARHPFLPLDARASVPSAIRLADRHSDRRYLAEPVPFLELSSLLLAACPDAEHHYLYPSAGSAYALQVYLQIREGRVAGAPAGLYYLHPTQRRLVSLARGPGIAAEDHFPTNQGWVEGASFALVVAADLEAMVPLYGQKSRDFCLLEAGHLGQLLQGLAPGLSIGICQSGVVDLARFRGALQLPASVEIMSTWMGGKVPRRAPVAELTAAPLTSATAPPPLVQPVHDAAVEAEVLARFRRLLGTESLDPTALLFDVGATSIMVATAVRELQEQYPAANLEVTDVFAHPSVRELAQHLATRLAEPSRTEAPRPVPVAAASPAAEPIAIVGLAVSVSGASSPQALAELLERGACRVGPQPAERREVVPRFRPRADQQFVGSYLSDIERFDPAFFHLSPREAERMDPAQRRMLEVTAELLASSGHLGGQLSVGRTGVWIGASRGDYAELRDPSDHDLSRLLPGNMAAIIANRISFFFDLSGPSVVVDTACSSSLVAVDQAVSALRSGDVDAAIAGGVNLLLSPEAFEAFRQDGMEGAGGQCRSFDASADGFVRGEGAGAVLLKRLSAAIKDQDTIYAVIRGSASNHDGRTNALPVPSPVAQRKVIELAHARAGTSPDTIDLVEAHGTGTRLGDPIEVRGLTDAFRAVSAEVGVTALGSIKTNLGHLEFAAGILGLIKATLALHRRTMPASLHFQAPNPHLELESSPFYVLDRTRPWPARGRPRRAAVSSFGVGGTNAHVILEEAPALAAPPAPERAASIIALSADTAEALQEAARALLEHLEAHPEIEPAALGPQLLLGRPLRAQRMALVVDSREQLLDQLSLAAFAPERIRAARALIGDASLEVGLSAARYSALGQELATLSVGAQRRLASVLRDPRCAGLLSVTASDGSPEGSEWRPLLRAAAELWVTGHTLDLLALLGPRTRAKVALPPLPLRRERVWWPGSSPAGEVSAVAPAAAPPAARGLDEGALQGFILERLSAALRLSPDRIQPRQPLTELGLDSLATVELMQALRERTGLELEASFFFEHPTVEKLVRGILARGPVALSPLAPSPPPAAPSARPEPSPSSAGKIAVIGLAAHVPGADSPDGFWTLLSKGKDAITEIPRSRFDVEAIFSADPKSGSGTYGRWGGFLSDLGRFDARFFRIPEREARNMDPQQQLLLTAAWEAVEDAGLAGEIAGSRTGVYVGASYTHHRDRLASEGRRFEDGHSALDNHNAILANRVSYFLDLHGPCVTVDTLCSSSLVALHAAIRALRAQEIDQAIVAGVHADLSPTYYEAVSRLGALSPDGRCRTFDARANGYVPGEGVVVVVLRRLEEAVASGDAIRGVILGSAVNHGGQTAGLTVPSPAAQAEVVRAALRDARIPGHSLSYVEAHGTGTSLGDPVEISGLAAAIGEGTDRRQFCGVGSVKSNIGHLEPASGLASLAKVLLALEHRQLPPTLHLATPNRAIAFEDGPCFVVDRLRPWIAEGPRRAGLSSFGLGGTNAHVIVEEAPPLAPRPPAELPGPSLFLLSAKSERALAAWASRVAAALPPEVPLRDLCASASLGRAQLPVRAALVIADRAGLIAGLQAIAAGTKPPILGSSPAAELARAFLAGQTIDARPLFPTVQKHHLPTYCFDAPGRAHPFEAELRTEHGRRLLRLSDGGPRP